MWASSCFLGRCKRVFMCVKCFLTTDPPPSSLSSSISFTYILYLHLKYISIHSFVNHTSLYTHTVVCLWLIYFKSLHLILKERGNLWRVKYFYVCSILAFHNLRVANICQTVSNEIVFWYVLYGLLD